MSEGWEERQTRSSRVSRAREIAYDVCSEVRQRNAFTHNVLDARMAYEKGLPPEERAFAIVLALGVTQTVGTLDEVIDGVLDRPRDVQPDVRDALRISTYEIIFLGKDPYAAVDQGVELVRSFNPRATRVANFVLRRVAALRDRFPFGDPEADLVVAARSQGFPYWLAELLADRLGEQGAREFMRVANEPAPVFVAVNAAKATDEEVLAVLRAAKGAPEPYAFEGREVPGCFRLGNRTALADGRVAHLLQLGQILVSDAASQEVSRMVVQTAYASKSRDADEPVRFLEVGSGRATKTILLQSQSRRQFGRYLDMTCVDNQDFKVNLLRKRVDLCGVPVREAVVADGARLQEPAALGGATFDAVFLDAPCTGLGTLRRHPEIRWRVSPGAIEESARLQLAMLTSAADAVRPGGVLVYATCTLTRTEDVDVVRQFLATDLGAHFRVAPIDGHGAFMSTMESGGSDAHFAVRFVRLN